MRTWVCVVWETQQETWLADARVTDEQQLEQVIVFWIHLFFVSTSGFVIFSDSLLLIFATHSRATHKIWTHATFEGDNIFATTRVMWIMSTINWLEGHVLYTLFHRSHFFSLSLSTRAFSLFFLRFKMGKNKRADRVAVERSVALPAGPMMSVTSKKTKIIIPEPTPLKPAIFPLNQLLPRTLLCPEFGLSLSLRC